MVSLLSPGVSPICSPSQCEQLLIVTSVKGYGWYLSSTAALLYCSYFIHNVVAWWKIRPFFTGTQASFRPTISLWVTRIYLSTLICSAGPLIYQIYSEHVISITATHGSAMRAFDSQAYQLWMFANSWSAVDNFRFFNKSVLSPLLYPEACSLLESV